MANKNRKLILSYFPTADTADKAADVMEKAQWDEADNDNDKEA
jgi:hypothetical protein